MVYARLTFEKSKCVSGGHTGHVGEEDVGRTRGSGNAGGRAHVRGAELGR